MTATPYPTAQAESSTKRVYLGGSVTSRVRAMTEIKPHNPKSRVLTIPRDDPGFLQKSLHNSSTVPATVQAQLLVHPIGQEDQCQPYWCDAIPENNSIGLFRGEPIIPAVS